MTSAPPPGNDPGDNDPEHIRREALGAFAHEIRTPLTSIRMVLELAKRLGSATRLVLDEEMGAMMYASVDDLQRLADDLQEVSRLERGRLMLMRGPCDLAAAVGAARELIAPGLELGGEAEAIEGPWDSRHLVRAISGFAQSANRIGDGSGVVNLSCAADGDHVRLEFRSGSPAMASKPIAADAGFSFFRSRQFILAMGGTVECTRADRFARIRVALPLNPPYTP